MVNAFYQAQHEYLMSQKSKRMHAGLAVLNVHDGLGQSVTNKVMLSAINRAKQNIISAVHVRNFGHFGTAMYYTKMAADAG